MKFVIKVKAKTEMALEDDSGRPRELYQSVDFSCNLKTFREE